MTTDHPAQHDELTHDERCVSSECQIRNHCTGAAACPRERDPRTDRPIEGPDMAAHMDREGEQPSEADAMAVLSMGGDPAPLTPGSTWTGPDGTVYDVVRPEEVGERARWWIDADAVLEYEHVAARGFGAGTNEDPTWQIGPGTPANLHCDRLDLVDGVAFALVLPVVPQSIPLRASLRSLLGLPADADDEAVRVAVERMAKRNGMLDRALTSLLDAIDDHLPPEREGEEQDVDKRIAAIGAMLEATRQRNAELFAELEEARSRLGDADRACEASRTAHHHLSATQSTLDNVIMSRDNWHQLADERSAALANLSAAHDSLEAAHLAVARDLADILEEWDGTDATDWPLTRKIQRLWRVAAEGRQAREVLAKQRKAQAKRVVRTAKGAKTIDADAVAGALRALAKAGTKSATAAEVCQHLGCYRSKSGWSERALTGYRLVGQALQKLKRDGKVALRGKRWALTRSGR